ncbi:MAG TPA: FtsQ-type POTRA domain-containing protein [Cellvibrionaceae bacterium]
MLLFGVYIAGSRVLNNFTSRPVEQVQVEGVFEYITREQVMNLITPAIDNKFMQLSIAQLKSQLEQESWIERATVTRKWPDTLHVALEEQVPIARWGDDGFLNHRGQVILVEDNSLLAQLPWLQGRQADSEKIMQHYLELGKLLRSRNLMMNKLHVDELGTWRLTLTSGANLVFGDSDILLKMQRFLYIYDRHLIDVFEAVASVDLRYANGLAVAWEDGYEVVIEGAS